MKGKNEHFRESKVKWTSLALSNSTFLYRALLFWGGFLRRKNSVLGGTQAPSRKFAFFRQKFERRFEWEFTRECEWAGSVHNEASVALWWLPQISNENSWNHCSQRYILIEATSSQKLCANRSATFCCGGQLSSSVWADTKFLFL